MTLLAALYGVASELPAVGPAANGLTASVLGLLLSAAYRLGRANIERPLTMTLTLLAFAAGGIFDVSAALIVVASGLVGILCLAPAAPKEGDR